MLYLEWRLLSLLLTLAGNSTATVPDQIKTVASNVTSCPCGYYDAGTKDLFTESIIAYLNETTALPLNGFVTESYDNKYERGFNSLFRQGASSTNVRLGNYSSFPSLELHISPPTPGHLVVGGGIRTSRQDIQYGSFRSLLRSPPEWPGGSALSMQLEYNRTESINLNLMNTNDPANAWIGMQIHQTLDREQGANYSDLTTNITCPWNYTEYRVDWTAEEVRFYIGGKQHRVVSKKGDDKLPSVPAPLYVKHWSVGNYETTQGPPIARSIANVGWVRLFFNASTMTDHDHLMFNSRCHQQPVCAMDDTSLRGSSTFAPEAELSWKQVPIKKSKRVPAIVIAALCIAVSSFLILNALLKRIPWDRLLGNKKVAPIEEKKKPARPSMSVQMNSFITEAKPAFTDPFTGEKSVKASDPSTGNETTPSPKSDSVHTIDSYDDPGSRPRPNTMLTVDPRIDALAALEGCPAETDAEARGSSPVTSNNILKNGLWVEAVRPRGSGSVSLLPALQEGSQSETARARSSKGVSLISKPKQSPNAAPIKPRGSGSVSFALTESPREQTVDKSRVGSVPTNTWVNPFEVRDRASSSHKIPETPAHAKDMFNDNGSVTTATRIAEATIRRKYSGPLTPGIPDNPAKDPLSKTGSSSISPSYANISTDPTTANRYSELLSPGNSETSADGVYRRRTRGSIPITLDVVSEELDKSKPDRRSYMFIPEPNTPFSVKAASARNSARRPSHLTSAFTEEHMRPRTTSAAFHIGLPLTKERIDYLAGLLALSSLIITVIQFCHTFSPALITSDAEAHYPSEIWTRRLISPYLMNPVWFGPFILTSSRFLATNYLRSGKLITIVKKTVGRTFRLMIPIVGIALLEYFLMDAGATKWLEYLPSITFSTWPFTAVPTTLGHFISDLLGLIYVIPNALPQIIRNYCTNILWTIPVQLQGSWTVLLSIIVIYEFKTPWKRIGYYVFCIINHWYALSWGSYFYFGVLLADLEITYKYRKWLYPRPLAYYPLIILCAVLALGGLSSDLATQWVGRDYLQYEYGIHPNNVTGLPIAQSSDKPDPPYFVPRLNGIIFAVSLQTLVEISPLLQKFFSIKPLIWLSRHTFTIYLIHGFIFWSLGSWLCIAMAVRAWPYWLNILLVAIACYSVLFFSLPALTPIVEILGKNSLRHLWYFAYEQPAPRRATLFPFPQDMLYLEHTVESGDKRSSTRKGSIMHRRGTYDLDEPLQSAARWDRRTSIMHRRGTYEPNDPEHESSMSDRRVSVMHRRATSDGDDPAPSIAPARKTSIYKRRGAPRPDEIHTGSASTSANRPNIELNSESVRANQPDEITTAPGSYREHRHVSIYEPESPTAPRKVSIYDRRGNSRDSGQQISPADQEVLQGSSNSGHQLSPGDQRGLLSRNSSGQLGSTSAPRSILSRESSGQQLSPDDQRGLLSRNSSGQQSSTSAPRSILSRQSSGQQASPASQSSQQVSPFGGRATQVQFAAESRPSPTMRRTSSYRNFSRVQRRDSELKPRD